MALTTLMRRTLQSSTTFDSVTVDDVIDGVLDTPSLIRSRYKRDPNVVGVSCLLTRHL